MNGSVFIHEPDPARLCTITPEDLDEFTQIGMDSLNTLDFETALAGTGIRWSQGQPLVFDETGGLAVFRVNPAALAYVFTQLDGFDAEQKKELRGLQAFVQKHGPNHIFEVATF